MRQTTAASVRLPASDTFSCSANSLRSLLYNRSKRKAADAPAASFKNPWSIASSRCRDCCLVHVVVRVDVLGVIPIFDRLEQPIHRGGLCAFELLVRRWHHRDLGNIGLEASLLDGLEYRIELLRVGRDLPRIAVVGQVVRSGFQRDL